MNYKVIYVRPEDVLNIKKQKMVYNSKIGTLLKYFNYTYEVLENYRFGDERINLRNHKLMFKYKLTNPHEWSYYINKLIDLGIIKKTHTEDRCLFYEKGKTAASTYDLNIDKYCELFNYISMLDAVQHPQFNWKITKNRYGTVVKYDINPLNDILSTYHLIGYSYSIKDIRKLMCYIPLIVTDCNKETMRRKQMVIHSDSYQEILEYSRVKKSKNKDIHRVEEEIESITDMMKETYIRLDTPLYKSYRGHIKDYFLHQAILKDELLKATIKEAENSGSEVRINVKCRKYAKGFKICFTARQMSKWCTMHNHRNGIYTGERNKELEENGFIPEYEYDIHSTIQTVSKAITTGELDLEFNLKDELMSIKPKKADGTELTREEVKTFGFRFYFFNTYKQAMSQYKYSLAHNKELPEVSDTQFCKMMQKSLSAIGKKTYGTRIFLYESLLELRTINLLKSMGVEVANVYDCFIPNQKVDIESVIYEAWVELKDFIKGETDGRI